MPRKGYKQTPEHIAKISAALRGKMPKFIPHNNKGIPLTEEHKEKLRQAKLNNPVRYWLNKKRPEISEILRNLKTGVPLTQATRLKMSQVKKGKMPANWGKSIGLSGEGNPMWKGGITPLNQIIRTSSRYKKWRTEVFERDNYTCQNPDCAQHGGELNADHIKSFALYPELRFELSNGRTLCLKCHRKTDTYGRYSWAKEVTHEN